MFVTVPKENKFCLFLQKFISSLKDPIFNFDVNMNCFCYCPKGMSYVTVFHSYASCQDGRVLVTVHFKLKQCKPLEATSTLRILTGRSFHFHFWLR